MILTGYSSDDLGTEKIYPIKTKYRGEKVGFCCYCDKRLTPKNYNREHIVLKSTGGTHTEPCCRRCNNLRGGLSLSNFKLKIAFWDIPVCETLLILENIDKFILLYPQAK